MYTYVCIYMYICTCTCTCTVYVRVVALRPLNSAAIYLSVHGIIHVYQYIYSMYIIICMNAILLCMHMSIYACTTIYYTHACVNNIIHKYMYMYIYI